MAEGDKAANLTSGQAMTASAAKALKELGFESQALAKAMQVDAQGSILKVLEPSPSCLKSCN